MHSTDGLNPEEERKTPSLLQASPAHHRVITCFPPAPHLLATCSPPAQWLRFRILGKKMKTASRLLLPALGDGYWDVFRNLTSARVSLWDFPCAHGLCHDKAVAGLSNSQ